MFTHRIAAGLGARLATVVILLTLAGGTGRAGDFVFDPGDPGGMTTGGHWAGDPNCDGRVNFYDIDPFVLALIDPSAYQMQYPSCDVLQADMNCDGVVNFDDIDAFVNALGCLECPDLPWQCP